MIPTLPHMCKVPRCADEGSESVEVSEGRRINPLLESLMNGTI